MPVHVERGRSIKMEHGSEQQVLQPPVLVRALQPPGLGLSIPLPLSAT